MVGAGLAGLRAARELVAARRNVVVIEASDRVGGRTLNASIGAGKVTEMGGQYADVLALLQQAGAVSAVSCRVRLDALPRVVRIEDLVASGSDPSLLPAGQDLGLTPTLYGK